MARSDFDLRSIRAQLKFTWGIFFARFKTLTPIQRKAIPEILNGNDDLIVIAPTNSGKTIAVIAPIIEWLHRRGLLQYKAIYVLYIVPTKPLARDLYRRLSGKLRALGIRVGIKTGDYPSLNFPLPHVLFMTPESLDSLLVRFPDLLETVKFVVIDEIHQINKEPRGDQLRVILERLRLRNPEIRTITMSATISDPIDIAKKYLRDRYKIIRAGHGRTHEYRIARSLKEALMRALSSDKNSYKKILVFVNTPEKAEIVAMEIRKLLKDIKAVVFAHHGRLDKFLRFLAERSLLGRLNAHIIVVATSTLEVGIDIGDIDFVILAEVPWSLQSFVQRIGRSSRRSPTIRFIAVANDDLEEAMYRKFIETMESKTYSRDTHRFDPGVIIQQILSVVLEYYEVDLNFIDRLFKNIDITPENIHGEDKEDDKPRESEVIYARVSKNEVEIIRDPINLFLENSNQNIIVLTSSRYIKDWDPHENATAVYRSKSKLKFNPLPHLGHKEYLTILAMHLQKLGYIHIEKKRNKLVLRPTERLIRLAELGIVHSNISRTDKITIIDYSTRRVLGRAKKVYGDIIPLGGSVWRVVKKTKNKVYVVKYDKPTEELKIEFDKQINRSKYYRLYPKIKPLQKHQQTLPSIVYVKESTFRKKQCSQILAHEYGHYLHLYLESEEFDDYWLRAYYLIDEDNALREQFHGLNLINTEYAMTNHHEFFAEIVEGIYAYAKKNEIEKIKAFINRVARIMKTKFGMEPITFDDIVEKLKASLNKTLFVIITPNKELTKHIVKCLKKFAETIYNLP